MLKNLHNNIKKIILLLFLIIPLNISAYISNEEASEILMDKITQEESFLLNELWVMGDEIGYLYEALSLEIDRDLYDQMEEDVTELLLNSKNYVKKYEKILVEIQSKQSQFNNLINNLPNYSKSSFPIMKSFYLKYINELKSSSKFLDNYSGLVVEQIQSIEKGDWDNYDQIMIYSRILMAEELERIVAFAKLSLELQTETALPGKMMKLNISILSGLADLFRFESMIESSKDLIEIELFNSSLNAVRENFINFESHKRDFYLAVNNFSLELKNLEAYMPSEFIAAINRAIKYSEDIVNSSDELKDSIFQKMVIYEKAYPYFPEETDDDFLNFQNKLDVANLAFQKASENFEAEFQNIIQIIQNSQ